MSIRKMGWSALMVGVCLAGVACGPSMEAQPEEVPLDGTVQQQAGVGSRCGGLPNTACDSGYVCVDDPSDSCNPNTGGRDCSGLCQCGTAPDYNYTLTDPAQCATVRFTCDSRREPFFNSCGCGCKVIGS